MPLIAFTEIRPAADCPCPGCRSERRSSATRHTPRRHVRALAVATVAGACGLAVTPGIAAAAQAVEAGRAPFPDGTRSTPQGPAGPLVRGSAKRLSTPGSTTTAAATTTTATRADIMRRAQQWVDAQVPYSMNAYRNGYRTDCSGFVSMAWGLGSNQWTGSLDRFGQRISKSELRPGDMLLFHNPADPGAGSHVVLFGGWTDASKTRYTAYEQTRPHTLKRTNPYAYWNNSSRYVAYRYTGLREGGGEDSGAYPGAHAFGPGADNAHVTRLGEMLVARGGGRFYTSGPGRVWGPADQAATKAFQEAQGWRGAEADGIPGPATWALLTGGKGRNIPSAGDGSATGSAFPGRQYFRPGQAGDHVTRLGRRLVERGYGRHYSAGPGPRWTESDRRNVEAFQRAQGWRGAEADGYPGPETWRRLFAPPGR
ncbi:peptidoglycan-binding protein [Streptomyces sp. NBC_01244]|uniref:peptidoglycan-binding protein n=1 Tax=Streptomyces sp. NBC_01244 TaxID=2903797 RepID=UPI002E162CE7|nr:peptidoglycan-binding protein [Streptomyces sp. NBC_01244]